MAKLIGNSLSPRAVDANGNPVSGALFSVFHNNSTAPVEAFADEAMTVKLSRPVVANSAGSAGPIYVPNGVYKIDFTSPDGVSLPGYPENDVEVQSTSEAALTAAIAGVQSHVADAHRSAQDSAASAGASQASAVASAQSASEARGFRDSASAHALMAGREAEAAGISEEHAKNAVEAADTALGAAQASLAPPYANLADFLAKTSNGDWGALATSNGVALYQNVGGAAEHKGWMSHPKFETRAAFVAWVAGNDFLVEGRVYEAGGFMYEAKIGATDIPDLPGLIPQGLIYAEHFGLHGDLTKSSQAEGYVRTGGTADNAAIEAADAYAIASGKGVVFCNSDIFTDGQINLSGHLHFQGGFRHYCWARMGELESGFVITDAKGGISGCLGIVQHDTGTKEDDRGHHGNFVTVGRFMHTSAQSRVHSININVRLCRAAIVAGQVSYPSPLMNAIGFVEHSAVEIGTFGKSNSKSSIFFQAHWGGYNTTGDPTAMPTVTYHPNNLNLKIVGPITDCKFGVVLSSVFTIDVSSFETSGVAHPFVVLPGDNINEHAISSQKAMVGQNIRVGFIKARGCEINAQDSASAIDITSRGTSKYRKFDGSSKFLIKQLDLDVKLEGASIELTGDHPASQGVRLLGVSGRVDLGKIYCKGETKAPVEVEHCNGDIRFDVREGSKEVRYEFSSGGSILGCAVDKSSNYEDDGYCLRVFGDNQSTVTTAAVPRGATRVPITGFSGIDVHKGDRLVIGGQPATATDFTDNGVAYLQVTPIQEDIASGATVLLDRTAVLKKMVVDYIGSENGAQIEGAFVDNADFSGVRGTGRHTAKISGNSRVFICADLPINASQLITATDSTFLVAPGSHVRLKRGIRAPANPSLQAHFFLQRSGPSGPWATLDARGIQIDDISNFYFSNDGFRQAVIEDCHDKNGLPVDHPEANGGDAANGFWRKYRDGRLHAWVRNKVTGSGPTTIWNVPGGNLAPTGEASVQITSANPSSARAAHGFNISASQVEFGITTHDGAAVQGAGANIDFWGRWR